MESDRETKNRQTEIETEGERRGQTGKERDRMHLHIREADRTRANRKTNSRRRPSLAKDKDVLLSSAWPDIPIKNSVNVS